MAPRAKRALGAKFARKGAQAVGAVRRAVAGRKAPAVPRPPAAAARPDPKLQAVADRAVLMLELAFQRAAAHDEHPKRYDLPSDPSCAERRIHRLLGDLPLLRRRALKKHLMASVDASASARRQKFGDLAQVDLKSPKSVLDQVRKLPVPPSVRMTAQDVQRLRQALSAASVPVQRGVPRLASVPQTLRARIRTLECLEDSKQQELGKDEISVSAEVFDDLGNFSTIGPLDLGKFEEGKSVTFGPLDVFTFNLGGGAFPKTFAVLFSVNEEDVFAPFEKAVVQLLAGFALMLAGIVATALGVPVVPLVLLSLGASFMVLAFTKGSKLLVRPRDENTVTFNSAAELSFLDANGQPSLTSVPLVRDQAVSGGRYRLTTDFVLV